MSQPPPPPEVHHAPPLPRRVPPVGQPKFHRYVAIVSYGCVGSEWHICVLLKKSQAEAIRQK